MTTAHLTVVIALAGCIACGGARPDPASLETVRGGQPHDQSRSAKGAAAHDSEDGPAGEMAGEMAAMPPEVKTFHDALAPRWHAEHGPQRISATCAAIPELRAGAEAIANAAPPAGAPAAPWTEAARGLGDAITALDGTCQAGDPAQFEPAFARVHERFHGLLSALGEHGEHGDEHEH